MQLTDLRLALPYTLSLSQIHLGLALGSLQPLTEK